MADKGVRSRVRGSRVEYRDPSEGQCLSQDQAQPDSFELDTVRYELRRGERVLRLEKIPMELLILLAERKDELVSRREIIEKLWGKDVLLDTEQGINTAVRKIRAGRRSRKSQVPADSRGQRLPICGSGNGSRRAESFDAHCG